MEPSRDHADKSAATPILMHDPPTIPTPWRTISVRSLAPASLWRADRSVPAEAPALPEVPRALLALWVAAIHLSGGAMLALCAAISRLNTGTRWVSLDPLAILWPYGHDAAILVGERDAVGVFANPLFVFPLLGVVPAIAMAALVWMRLSLGGSAVPPGRTLRACARAAVLALPWCLAWTWAWFAGFVATALLADPSGRGPIGPGSILTPLMGLYAIALIWWWRRFVVDHARLRRGAWVLMPMGFIALVATTLLGVGLKIAIGAA